VTNLKLKMHIREHSHKGVRLPEEFDAPKGVFKWMPNGGFVIQRKPLPNGRKPLELRRWLAFCEPVEVVDGHLQLPRVYTRLGLLPRIGENVVIFGGEKWMEIWPIDKWVEQMRLTAADLPNLIAAVKDELEARGK
jgi:hypothetical protein